MNPTNNSNGYNTMLPRRLSFILLALLSILPVSTLSQATSAPSISRHGISFSTGNKFITQKDISLTGPVSSLTFSRYYNSQSKENNSLGYGWSNTHDEHLRFIESHNLIILTKADGRMVHFRHNGVDAWINKTNKVAIITEHEDGGYQLTPPNNTSKHFNIAGQLIEKHDHNNNSTFYTYSGDALTSIGDAFGRKFTLNYGEDSRLQSLTTAIGTISYSYDVNENLISVLKPDGTSTTYLYEDPNDVHNLTGIIDESGTRTLAVGYDNRDRVTSSAFTNGTEAVTIVYQRGYKRVITNSLGVSSTYQLEVMHGVARVRSFTGPGCSSCGTDGGSSFTYNERQQVTSSTDALGNTTTFAYDAHGNRTQVTNGTGTPLEQTTTYTYQQDSNLLASVRQSSVANPDEVTTSSMMYDTSGNLISRTESGFSGTEAINSTTSYTRDTYGRITSIDGPRTDVNDSTTFSYYPNTQEEGLNRGFLHKVSNSLGQITTYSNYTAIGQAETVISPTSNSTMTFDSMGRVLTRTTNGKTITATYDLTGNLEKLDLPGGRSVTYTYNNAGKLVRVEDNMGNALTYSYNSEGHKDKEEARNQADEIQRFVSYEYDDSGHLNKTIQPDATYSQQNYNEVGDLVSQINAMGQQTSYDYDALGRLSTITAPSEGTTSYTYDSQNNLTSVTDANGNQTSFIYDDLGRKTNRTSADSGLTTYQYDKAGNLTSSTNGNNVTTTYDYDSQNRLLSIHYPDNNQDTTYSYEQSTGRLLSVQDNTGSSSYQYNSNGELTGETRTIGEQSFTVNYSYNDNYEPISITYPSGRVITYTRDNTGRVANVTSTYDDETITLSENISYLPFGPRISMTLGNNLQMNNSYDQMYRLTGSVAGGLYNRDYTYYASGTVQNITDNVDPSASQNFIYNDLNRLVSAQGKYGNLAYAYDNVGNRLSRTQGTETTSYTYNQDSNRLSQFSNQETVDYSYDNAGNILAKANQEFSWSQDNRLLAAMDNGSTVGQYGYDARGLRTVQTTATGTIFSVYDQSGNLLLESDGQGHILREFVYLNGNKISHFDYTLESDFTVEVSGSTERPLEKVKVYAFDENNRYTGLNSITNEKGHATFSRDDFGQGSYMFRCNYLRLHYWSNPVVVEQHNRTQVAIDEEPVQITVNTPGGQIEGIRVHLFDAEGRYLGVSAYTDENGVAAFLVPLGISFTYRATYLRNQYWSSITTESTSINTGGGALSLLLQKEDNSPLANARIYLYSTADKYLGVSTRTDEQGVALLNIPEGAYKIRADYLRMHYWSDHISMTEDYDSILSIPHRDVTVTVQGDNEGDVQAHAGINVALFTDGGSSLGLKGTTDENGQTVFNLPVQPISVRASYLRNTFWSEASADDTISLTINEGIAAVQVNCLEASIPDITIHAYTHEGKHLGLKTTTDSDGEAIFRLPEGSYLFRASYMGNYYWAEPTSLLANQQTTIPITTGGGAFSVSLTTDDASPLTEVKAWLYSNTDKYLGRTAVTDENGKVTFQAPDGSYKIKFKYLGYIWWSTTLQVPEEDNIELAVPHRDIIVTVLGDYNGDHRPYEDFKVMLYNDQDRYSRLTSRTNEQGQVVFSIPEQPFKARLIYSTNSYWSDLFTWTDTELIVQEGMVQVLVNRDDEALPDVNVRVFNSDDRNLRLSAATNNQGTALFRLPGGTFKFRADYLRNRYWASSPVLVNQENLLTLETGGGTISMVLLKDDTEPLANVQTRLYNSEGRSLGESASTDETGQVSFKVSDGDYQIRVDYLGYQFWSDVTTVPNQLSLVMSIPHQEVIVTVIADYGETSEPLANVATRIYTAEDKWVPFSGASNEAGQIRYQLPQQSYKMRATYKQQQYWSEASIWSNSDIAIPHGEVELSLSDSGAPIANQLVRVYTENGAYMGIKASSDANGLVRFTLPAQPIQFQISYQEIEQWSEVLQVLPHELTEVELNFSTLALNLTNNPNPERIDGEAPVYKPMLAMVWSLAGIYASPMDQGVAVTNDARLFYYLSDHLGTAQVMTDSLGEIVWQANYMPFGQVDVLVNRLENRFRFPGQYFDAETGLHYNWHRFYDPATGRYISADPIGLQGGINLYAYVSNDPVNFIDPWGLDWKRAIDILTDTFDGGHSAMSNAFDDYARNYCENNYKRSLKQCEKDCDPNRKASCIIKAKDTYEKCKKNSRYMPPEKADWATKTPIYRPNKRMQR